MLDLSAAFDTLDHNLLVKRLRSYFGFSGIALQWFLSYLHGRSQRVIIGDTIFPPRYLEFGVPQGSILAPYYLLFILHLFRMWYSPKISNTCSMLRTVKYILLLTLTIQVTPLLPCGNVLSIFSHGTPETCLRAILERSRCCILHRVLWSNHHLVTASHLQGLKLTPQRKQGI